MMNHELAGYCGLVFTGMLLGAFFFTGLWLTVRQMQTSRWPAALFMTSLVARTTVVLTGIWYVSGGDSLAIVACVAGFLALRLMATHGRLLDHMTSRARKTGP